MTEEEKKIIRDFAAGEVMLREKAVSIFYKYLREQLHSTEMLFMSEIESPVPDLALRSQFRAQLVRNRT